MGETLVAGLVRSGWKPQDIIAVDAMPERMEQIAYRYGVNSADLDKAAEQANTVVVVVKPQDSTDVFPQVAKHIRPGTLIISLCAGVTTQLIESFMPEGTPVVRVMPNTPARVDEGMAAVSPGVCAQKEHLKYAVDLLSAVGKAIVVPERYQDAVTAISGSGPAYLFFVVEAMIDAGVMLGLPRDTATVLVNQTMYGSAKLLVESGEHPTVLRERVTSPGGTTAAAQRMLEENKVKAAFMEAMEAARDRSAALAKKAANRAAKLG
jgi:pyrroline-5-carboxylate reductase